ncbi:MAG: DegT/DnrJ/EryC1/StrS family aminotransferase [Bacteroidota bacterium]|nr:DegT/DnrJ/EryC1/StrS family aminotransferase [Bacteroidota bacterium]
MKVPFIDFDYELDLFGNNYESLLIEHVQKGEFIGGESVNRFEENLKNYLNTKHIITVGNGTDALLISLLSLELERKEVIVPSFSFFATSEAIVQAGLIPIFVDIDIANCNIDVKKIEEKITSNTGAILPVHLFGNPSNMEKILDIAKKYDLKIVEDVAQAFGSEIDKKKLGTIGDIGCFSFFPTKTLGAYGDGGAISTNSDIFAERANMYKNHGAKTKYNNEIFGYNSRLDSIQASILGLKLQKIDQWIENRVVAGKYYDSHLKEIENLNLLENENSTFNYYSILIGRNKRDLLKDYLLNNEVSVAVYYPKTLPSLPAHNNKESFPVSERASTEILSLPIWPGVKKEQQEYVIELIQKFFTNRI